MKGLNIMVYAICVNTSTITYNISISLTTVNSIGRNPTSQTFGLFQLCEHYLYTYIHVKDPIRFLTFQAKINLNSFVYTLIDYNHINVLYD